MLDRLKQRRCIFALASKKPNRLSTQPSVKTPNERNAVLLLVQKKKKETHLGYVCRAVPLLISDPFLQANSCFASLPTTPFVYSLPFLFPYPFPCGVVILHNIRQKQPRLTFECRSSSTPVCLIETASQGILLHVSFVFRCFSVCSHTTSSRPSAHHFPTRAGSSPDRHPHSLVLRPAFVDRCG